MASQKLKEFLSSVNIKYLDHAHIIHQSQFADQAELAVANRTALELSKVTKGAAGQMIAAARGGDNSFMTFISAFM